jgi:hypothetical protein
VRVLRNVILSVGIFGCTILANAQDVGTLQNESVLKPEVAIPLQGGTIVISQQRVLYDLVPRLAFTLTNRTSSTWLWILLRFDLVSSCKTESPRSWTLTIPTDAGWSKDQPSEKQHKIPLVELMDGRISDSEKDCTTDVNNVSLVFAQTLPPGYAPTVRIDGSGKAVDSETGDSMVTLAASNINMGGRLLYTENIERPAIARADAAARAKHEQEKAAESAK